MKHLLALLLLMTCLSVTGATGEEADLKSLNKQIDLLLQRYAQAKDSTAREQLTADIVTAALRCDSMDTAENGTPRLREKNFGRTYRLLPRLVAIARQSERRQPLRAARFYRLYLRAAASDLYPAQNAFVGTSAWRLCRMAFEAKDYTTADHYANMALRDDSLAARAAEIKLQCMEATMKTKADSTKFLVAALELHSKAPDNALYSSMLMQFFARPGHENELAQYARDEVRREPANPKTWLLKAETEMKRRAWDDAVASYKKVLELNGDIVQADYNIGVCLVSKAVELNDSLKDAKGRLRRDEAGRVKGILKQAQDYLEQARQRDPQRALVDWAKPLYQVYFVLKDKRAKELEDYLK